MTALAKPAAIINDRFVPSSERALHITKTYNCLTVKNCGLRPKMSV
jgi:hypothetical protein